MPDLSLLTCLLLATALLLSSLHSYAHPAFLTAARALVKADGSVRLTLSCDILAFALNDTSARIGNEPMEALLSGPRENLERCLADGRGRLLRGVKLITDRGESAPVSVEFPTAKDIDAWKQGGEPALPLVLEAKLTAALPPGAKSIALQFPEVLDRLILTVERPGEEGYSEPVDAGSVSTPLPIHLQGPAPAPPRSAASAKSPQPAISNLNS